MTDTTEPNYDELYPEHAKMRPIQETSQTIGDFLDWLENEKGYQLARWGEHQLLEYDDKLYPVHDRKKDLLAEFFEIDLVKFEGEKGRMLAHIHELNARADAEREARRR